MGLLWSIERKGGREVSCPLVSLFAPRRFSNKSHQINRPSQELRMKMTPSVAAFFNTLRRGNEGNGDILHRIFGDLVRMEATYRVILEDLRRRVYNPAIFKASLTSLNRAILGNVFAWVRIGCHGISQRDVDFIRQFFPGVIVGHDKINAAKVIPFVAI